MRNLLLAVVLVCLSAALWADDPATPAVAPLANSNAIYAQLRRPSLGSESVSLHDFALRRDGATFKLTGTVTFLQPVEGKVTGAVFSGQGVFTIEPPPPVERRNLAFYFGDEYRENFSELVLRFTDGTYEELKKAGAPAAAPAPAGYLNGIEDALRDNLKYNLAARILEDLLNPDEASGTFWAFLHGGKHGKLLFVVDPHGVPSVGNYETAHDFPAISPEEVALLTYSDDPWGMWTAYHQPEEYASGTASSREQNGTVQILQQKLDTHFEKSGYLSATSETTLVALQGGVRVVPFDLFHRLRVDKVSGANGQPLEFIQEGSSRDCQLWVILPKGLSAGEKTTVKMSYAGKDAVTNEGGGNYFPVARTDWYPNSIYLPFGSFTSYDMTFHTPKGLEMIATGEEVSATRQGNEEVSEWKTTEPVVIAGLNFGKFKHQEAQVKSASVLVQSYANEVPPNWVKDYLNAASSPLPESVQGSINTPAYRAETEQSNVGTMDTTTMMKRPLSEGQMAVQLFTDYFGPLPFKHVAFTQQTACDFGQAWPSLVYIPICSYFDDTVKHRLGLLYGDRGYWLAVTAHEAAHQWWAHTVATASYRDTWMSEGFASFSAALYLQNAFGTARYRKFWDDQLWFLTQKDRFGNLPVSVGPVTIGTRLVTSTTGSGSYQSIVYSKGAYILHMLRMMMWNAREGDTAFKAMMHDYVQTYRGQAATTEDFKEIVEKHMTPAMDLDKNHKMDWFFREYVYGTSLPHYAYKYSFTTAADGQVELHLALTQSGVGDDFKMVVPIYAELADGRVVRFGTAPMEGSNTMNIDVPLGIKQMPKAISVSYFYDVLGTVEQLK